jgi:hypothetical protein
MLQGSLPERYASLLLGPSSTLRASANGAGNGWAGSSARPYSSILGGAPSKNSSQTNRGKPVPLARPPSRPLFESSGDELRNQHRAAPFASTPLLSPRSYARLTRIIHDASAKRPWDGCAGLGWGTTLSRKPEGAFCESDAGLEGATEGEKRRGKVPRDGRPLGVVGHDAG